MSRKTELAYGTAAEALRAEHPDAVSCHVNHDDVLVATGDARLIAARIVDAYRADSVADGVDYLATMVASGDVLFDGYSATLRQTIESTAAA